MLLHTISNCFFIVPLLLSSVHLMPLNKHHVPKFRGISVIGTQMIFYVFDRMMHTSLVYNPLSLS